MTKDCGVFMRVQQDCVELFLEAEISPCHPMTDSGCRVSFEP